MSFLVKENLECEIPTRYLSPSDSRLIPEGLTGEDALNLIDGTDQCDGRLQVEHGGHQGLVCADHWGMQEASVTCRQLGCSHARSTYQFILRPEEMKAPWLYGTNCSGEEATLWNCTLGTWGPLSDCKCQCVVSINCAGESDGAYSNP